jgi:hypothetical protein
MLKYRHLALGSTLEKGSLLVIKSWNGMRGTHRVRYRVSPRCGHSMSVLLLLEQG